LLTIAILQRTYHHGKAASATTRAQPAEFHFEDVWTHDRAAVAHWPYLEFLLDLLQQHNGLA